MAQEQQPNFHVAAPENLDGGPEGSNAEFNRPATPAPVVLSPVAVEPAAEPEVAREPPAPSPAAAAEPTATRPPVVPAAVPVPAPQAPPVAVVSRAPSPAAPAGGRAAAPDLKLAEKVSVRALKFYYGDSLALKDINLPLYANKVTAFIGPSGCGKSTLLRVLNRMYDLYPNQRAVGEVLLDGENILRPRQDLNLLRARVGMVFQKPTPFPMSIYDNIAFGIRLYERLSRSDLDERVETALKGAALWGEVKDKLRASGLSLSGGQQQRLCIARTVAIHPEVILFDEPCSALDPISTAKIEELIDELKEKYTIAIVTHNMQQAARCSDYTAFMYLGELIEFGLTAHIFTSPTQKATQNYITGRFG